MCITRGQPSAQALHLGGTAAHHDVAADVAEGLALEAKVDEGMAYLLLRDFRRYLTADDLHSQADRHELALFAFFRWTEIPEHELTLSAWCLIRLIMPLQPFYLGTVEPVVEALLV